MNDDPEHLVEIQPMVGARRRDIPDAMQAFTRLHKAAASDGFLSAKVNELLALAIAVTVRCDGCIAFRVQVALRAGATREEIVEALGVAIRLGGGSAVICASQTLTAVGQFEAESTPA